MKPKHYEFIDALRGYAILLVIAVHVSHRAKDLTGISKLILNEGAKGVQLFFIASALTLCLSWQTRKDGLISFYIRRIFRIAPMFWLAISFFVYFYGYGSREFAPNGITNVHIISTLLFVNGWHPESISSVVPGGWSIAVEMAFYIIFPILVFYIRNFSASVIAFCISIVFANILFYVMWVSRTTFWPDLPDSIVATFLSLWLPSQLPVFIIGFLLYFSIRDFRDRLPSWLGLTFVVSSLFMLACLIMAPLPVKLFGVSSYAAYGLCFGIFAFGIANENSKTLVNPIIGYIGKISFSAYLWHFVILGAIDRMQEFESYRFRIIDMHRGLLFFVIYYTAIVIATVFFSSVTYRFIEIPFVKIGNRVVKWLDSRNLN